MFNEEGKVFEYLRNFLSKFKNLEDLRKTIYRKFDFIKTKNDPRVEAYKLLKDELEDDIDFEKFCERYKTYF